MGGRTNERVCLGCLRYDRSSRFKLPMWADFGEPKIKNERNNNNERELICRFKTRLCCRGEEGGMDLKEDIEHGLSVDGAWQ